MATTLERSHNFFKRHRKIYMTTILIIILIGVFLRTYKLTVVPPYRDEVSLLITSILWLKNYEPFRLMIGQFIANPFSPLLSIIDLSRLNINNYYLLTRLPGLFYGIILMIILMYMSDKIIKNNVLKILSFILVSVSTPILIHRARLSVISIQATSLYYICLAFLLFIINNKKKPRFTSLIILYALFGIIFHIYDVRTLPYLMAIMLATFLSTMRLTGLKSAFFLNSIGFMTFILEIVILRPQYIYFIFHKKISSNVLYVSSTINTNITIALQNVILQLDPRFIAFDGGLSLASRIQAPFQHLLTLEAIYRVNGGFGVLGYWGLSFYVIVPLTIYIYLRIRRNLTHIDKLSLEMFIFSVISYIMSVSLYKYGVPHAARHLFFFALVPITTCKIIDIILNNMRLFNRYIEVLAYFLLIFIIFASILTSTLFFINYYRNENNPATLYAFEAQYHIPIITAYKNILCYVNNAQENKHAMQIAIIYCFKNHERFVYVNAQTITRYGVYYAIKFFNTYNISDLRGDRFRILNKNVEFTFWVTSTPWLEYVFVEPKYRPPWLLKSNLIVIVTEKNLSSNSIKFLSSHGFIIRKSIKIDLWFLDSYYSMVSVSSETKMPTNIYIYVFEHS